MGACRVEYLLQSLSCSGLLKEVIYLCENGLWRGLEATLGITPIPEAAWEQALVPIRLGGLGLRSPAKIRNDARLAALVNVSDRVLTLGASPEHLRADFETALDDMCHDLKVAHLARLRPLAWPAVRKPRVSIYP